MHAARESAAPRFPFTAFPRGWFAVAFSHELVAGEVRRLRYFGRELVAYRGASGAPFVLDAYCPHLGAHLGHGGVVEGDTLRCPFHGWRFEGDGRCAEIPYAQHVPPRARLGALPVREDHGAVLVFHDPSGHDPSGRVEPWELPTIDWEGWTPGREVLWPALRTHPQEVFENTVDVAHIGPVHGGLGARLIGPPRREAERLAIDIEFEAPGDVVGMPGEINDVRLDVRMVGLGWVMVDTHVRNVGVRARQRILVTPVDEEHVDIRGIVYVKDEGDAAFTEEVGRIFYEAYVEDFAKDFPIWENKRYLDRPGLAKGDGPIGTYRKWCEQFYPSEATHPLPRTRAGWREGLRASARKMLALLTPKPAEPARVSSPSPTPATRAAAAPPAPAPRAVPTIRSAREYRDTLTARFVPDAARGVRAVFQWELGGDEGETFHAEVEDGAIAVHEGAHARPTVTLQMPALDYVRMINGEIDGMSAFTRGIGKVCGDLRTAMKMRGIFPA